MSVEGVRCTWRLYRSKAASQIKTNRKSSNSSEEVVDGDGRQFNRLVVYPCCPGSGSRAPAQAETVGVAPRTSMRCGDVGRSTEPGGQETREEAACRVVRGTGKVMGRL